VYGEVPGTLKWLVLWSGCGGNARKYINTNWVGSTTRYQL